MSELSKSRRNRVRRNVTALVSAVALACGTTAVVPQVAGAYTPIENRNCLDGNGRPIPDCKGLTDQQAEDWYIQGRNGDKPWVVLGVDIEVEGERAQDALNNGQAPNWPEPGQSFNYYVYPQPGAPNTTRGGQPAEVGQSDIEYFSLTLLLPPEAPLNRAPRPDDFFWVNEDQQPVAPRGFAGVGSATLGEYIDQLNQQREAAGKRPLSDEEVQRDELNLPIMVGRDTVIWEVEFTDIPGGISLDHAQLPARIDPAISPGLTLGYQAFAEAGIKPFSEWSKAKNVELVEIPGEPFRRVAVGDYTLNGGGRNGIEYFYPYEVPGQNLSRAELEKLQTDPNTPPKTIVYVDRNDSAGTTNQNSSGYGQWMLELWTGSNVPFVRLVGDPTVTFSHEDGFVLPDGSVKDSVTMKELMDFGVVQEGDVNSSEFTDPEGAKEFRGANWQQVYHWEFNRSNGGRLWLPDGTKVHVEQIVEDSSRGGQRIFDQFQHHAFFTGAYNRLTAENSAGAGDTAGRRAPVPMGFLVGEPSQPWDQPALNDNWIGDRVWVDSNANGIQDDGENEGVANVLVTAVPNDGSETLSTSTSANGSWRIYGLKPGVEYTINFELPEPNYLQPDRFIETVHGAGDDRSVDSNGSGTTVTLLDGNSSDDTYDFGVVRYASVGDRVWIDTDKDGIQGDNEFQGVPGVGVTATVKDLKGRNVPDDQRVKTATTDQNGFWRIEDLYPGVEYEINFNEDTLPRGFAPTKSGQGEDGGKDSNGLNSTVTLVSGQFDRTYDLGVVNTASVGDRVWVDANRNGIQDEGENGLSGVRVIVEALGEQGRTVTTTDEDGKWRVDGLTPGVEYTVTFEVPNGYRATTSNAGNDLEKDSNGVQSKVRLEAGEFDQSIDFGVFQTTAIGDFVWHDKNDNGIQDKGEPGVPGALVTVEGGPEDGTPVTRTVVSDADGNWLVDDLVPGTYSVTFTPPEGYGITETKQRENGGNNENDSNGLQTPGIKLEAGQPDRTIDLGLVKLPEPTTPATPTPETVTATPTTTPPTCDECTPTTVVQTSIIEITKEVPTTEIQRVPTTVKETETKEVVTTVSGTPVTSTVTEVNETTKVVETTKVEPVPTTVVKTTTNKVVVTDENTAIIGDKVFIDTNGDGKQDPNENEGVPGVSVIVTGKDGEEQRTVTDKDGNWHLVVQPGDFTVRYETDRIPSDPELIERTVTLKPGEENRDIDLGVLRPGTVGDRVWNDTNGDGKQDEGEEGIPNITVKVSREGEPARFTVTDEKGFWLIDELSPNTDYTVEFLTPEGWTRTNTVPETVKVKPGESIDTYDLGLRKVEPEVVEKPGSLNGVIRVKDKDGKERGFEGLVVTVTPPEGVDEETRRTVTDEGGAWSVTNLTPGVNYRVEYIVPEGYDVTNLPEGWTVEDGRIVVDQTIDESNPVVLELGFTLQPKVLAPTTVTETTTVTAPDGSSSDFLDRCWANATQSPLLYLVPVALLGAVAGEFAKPYMGVLNEQLAQINAELQAALNRNTPDFGDGGRGADRDDPFAELRAQINAANREVARIANDPDTQRLGAIALGVIGVIAAGGVIYDWCSSEPGEAVTASSIGKGKGATATPVTAPTTPTEPAAAQ